MGAGLLRTKADNKSYLFRLYRIGDIRKNSLSDIFYNSFLLGLFVHRLFLYSNEVISTLTEQPKLQPTVLGLSTLAVLNVSVLVLFIGSTIQGHEEPHPSQIGGKYIPKVHPGSTRHCRFLANRFKATKY